MPIVNLTNQTIRLANEDGDVVRTFEPSRTSITLQTQGEEHQVDGVTVDVTFVSGMQGLPEPEEGTFYIVPQPVAYVLNRPDFLLPDTGPSAIRDDDGHVYAVRRLYSVTGKR